MTFLCLYEIANFIVLYRVISILYLICMRVLCLLMKGTGITPLLIDYFLLVTAKTANALKASAVLLYSK
jgi:hypothetical protein